MGPAGNDSADGLAPSTAVRTIARAYAVRLAAGGCLDVVLLAGVHASLGQPPSGTAACETVIRADVPGQARVSGGVSLGTTSAKVQRVTLRGLVLQSYLDLYNTARVTVREVGVQGGIGIGTNDHAQGNTDNLIEDVWVRAAGERIIAINYRADRNVWRRVVVRGDGCGTSACQGSGNPNVGITVYESVDVSLQNVVVVDRVLAPTDYGYADFAVAAHSSTLKTGRAEWLGVMSLKAPDQGFNMDPDGTATTVSPTLTLRDVVVYGSADYGAYFAKGIQDGVWDGWTIAQSASRGITVDAQVLRPTMRNMLVYRASGFGIKFPQASVLPVDYVNTFATGVAFEQNSRKCVTGCYAVDPAAGSQLYLPRVEAGSFLAGKGPAGADIGARVVQRYGADGSRFGEPGYNTLTAAPLWPWPHEARIRQELCTDVAVTRGFCAGGTRLDGVKPVTFSSYVWELLGNAAPAEVAP